MKTHRMLLKAAVFPKSLAASGLLLALLLAMAASSAPVVHAATITVNSTEDSLVNGDGKCTLREAIRNANNNDQGREDCVGGSGADVITFTVTGTILLGSNLEAIADAVTISGPGESSLFLDGDYSHRGLYVSCSSPGCSVNISGLTIQNGLAASGPAINNADSNVTLSHVTIKNNTVPAIGWGAAVVCTGNNASMTLNDAVISNNSATSTTTSAGGLYGSADCLLSLNNVMFDHNTSSNGAGGMRTDGAASLDHVYFNYNTTTGSSGGALIAAGTVTVTHSVFSNNQATVTGGWGGALYVYGPNWASIDNSTFIGNSADVGAGIEIDGSAAQLTVTNTTFDANIAHVYGGGIGSSGTLTVTNVTFNGNQALDPGGYGGAVSNDIGGQITLTNATFDGNSAAYGSAIFNGSSSTMTLVNNTIATNFNGPAISGVSGTTSGITLTNTIVSDNALGNCGLLSGTVTDGGGNLNFASHGHDCPGISADPWLYWLGYNGGPVMTRPFLTGSGAINAGNAATCAAAVGAPTFGAGGVDARGQPRRSGFCDIGAFEAQPASLSTTAGSSPQSAIITTAFAHSLGVQVTDAYTNTLGGATVTYSAPASGASAVLSATTANSNASGNASVTATANGLAGSYSVTASATGVTPVAFNLTNTPGSTTTSITSHLPHPSRAGQAVTVLYTVTSPNGTPTGNVTVSAGTTNCTGTVAAGSCSMTFTTPGTRTLIASYAGDGGFSASTSSSHTHTVDDWGVHLPLLIRP